MKVYVSCDLEGVAGIANHREQCSWDLKKGWFGSFYEQARRLATLELNAVVEGAIEAGATEVYAWDGHGDFPGGIDPELLHPACRMVMCAGNGGPAGLDETFDAFLLCGLHAMAGTVNGVLAHSFYPEMEGYWVNDTPVGEIWMNCFMAGQSGIPCVFLSGDEAATVEFLALVPKASTVAVKKGISGKVTGLSPGANVTLSPQKARELIQCTARKAVESRNEVKPFWIKGPYTLKKKLRSEKLADKLSKSGKVKRLDSRTVILENAEEPWLLI